MQLGPWTWKYLVRLCKPFNVEIWVAMGDHYSRIAYTQYVHHPVHGISSSIRSVPTQTRKVVGRGCGGQAQPQLNKKLLVSKAKKIQT